MDFRACMGRGGSEEFGDGPFNKGSVGRFLWKACLRQPRPGRRAVRRGVGRSHRLGEECERVARRIVD